MKTVLYLDVDGVLWDFETFTLQYHAAKGLPEFLDFALTHFDVRWLTSWTLSGKMHEPGYRDLVAYTDVPIEVWKRVNDGDRWRDSKIEGIDPDIPFVWVEDGLIQEELRWLDDRGWLDRYYHTETVLVHGGSAPCVGRVEKSINPFSINTYCFNQLKPL